MYSLFANVHLDIPLPSRLNRAQAMRVCRTTLGFVVVAVGCGTQTAGRSTKEPVVTVSVANRNVVATDSLTFVAKIRADVAAKMRPADRPGDPDNRVPQIVGWLWIPDLDIVDPWTKACERRDLTCRIMVHGSGTMAFSVRLPNDICADWVHIVARIPPGFDEGDSVRAVRSDSIDAAIQTKVPSWPRCTE
jgi:hypothetical protein